MFQILLQVDFSENASLANQNEIQSVYWSHGEATLFTAHAWIQSDPDKRESMVIVSDDLQHNKLSVHAYMSYIFTTLKQKYASIEEINVVLSLMALARKDSFFLICMFGNRNLQSN